jgi:uncharacterized protein
MLGMDAGLVDRLTTAAERAFAGTPVRFAYLFGSQATGRTHAHSDVDVAVLLGDQVPRDRYFDLRLALWRRLEDAARVDIDLVLLNTAPLGLQGRILRDRAVLYSVDEPARVAYESRTAREFADFDRHDQELARHYLEDVAEGLR